MATDSASAANYVEKISFGGLETDVEVDAQEVKRSLKVASHALKQKALADVPDVGDAKTIIKKAKKTIKLVSELRSKHRKDEVEKVLVLSFSKVTTRHLGAMGITPSKRSILNPDNMHPVLQTALDAPRMILPHGRSMPRESDLNRELEDYWSKAEAILLADLSVVLLAASQHTEARSRLIIDLFVFRLIHFMFHQLNEPVLLCPELQIATLTSPVTILYNKTLTVLTGSVDYAIFTHFKPRRHIENNKDLMQEIRKEVLDAGNLESVVQGLKKYLSTSKLQIFLAEAKKAGSDLKSFVPQATAESIATMQKLETACIAWCLTDGTQWIFGLVKRSEGEEALEVDHRVYQTEPIKYNEEWDEDGRSLLPSKTLQFFFTLLVLWSSVPPTKLVDTFNLTKHDRS